MDLDAQQFVVWNAGLIAASGGPDALDIFRRSCASASNPRVCQRGGRRTGSAIARDRTIFVIHNGKLSEAPSPTPRSLRGIAWRVIEASVRAGVVGDLIRIYAFAQRDQASFHWVTIDERVDLTGAEVFDPVKMGELYAIGDQTARAGPEWEVRPPGFQDVQPPP